MMKRYTFQGIYRNLLISMWSSAGDFSSLPSARFTQKLTFFVNLPCQEGGARNTQMRVIHGRIWYMYFTKFYFILLLLMMNMCTKLPDDNKHFLSTVTIIYNGFTYKGLQFDVWTYCWMQIHRKISFSEWSSVVGDK